MRDGEYRVRLLVRTRQNSPNPASNWLSRGKGFNSTVGCFDIQVLQKIMADPELAMAFSNPKVQEAVMDVSTNPMNIVKYQNEPDVLKVRPRHHGSPHAF